MKFTNVTRVSFPTLTLSRVHSANKGVPEFKAIIAANAKSQKIIEEQKKIILNMPVGKTYHFDMFDTNGASIEHDSNWSWILSASTGGFQVSIVLDMQSLDDYVELSVANSTDEEDAAASSFTSAAAKL